MIIYGYYFQEVSTIEDDVDNASVDLLDTEDSGSDFDSTELANNKSKSSSNLNSNSSSESKKSKKLKKFFNFSRKKEKVV